MATKHASNLSQPGAARWMALSLVLGLGMAGCSGNNQNREVVNEVIQKAKEYTELEAKMAELEREKQQYESELPQLRKKLEDHQTRIDNLKGELSALGSGEDQSYAEYQERIQEATPDVVIIMSERFIRDYPLSSRKDEIKAKLEAAKANQKDLLAEQRENEAERQAELAAQRQARLAKFKAGKMSTVELKSYLGGKSEREVVELMGQPSSKSKTTVWNYRNYYGISSTGKQGRLRLYFSGGRVNSVGLY